MNRIPANLLETFAGHDARTSGPARESSCSARADGITARDFFNAERGRRNAESAADCLGCRECLSNGSISGARFQVPDGWTAAGPLVLDGAVSAPPVSPDELTGVGPHDPQAPSAAPLLTAKQIAKRDRNLALWITWLDLKARARESGSRLSISSAARQMGIPQKQLWTVIQLGEQGEAQLTPKTSRCGRKKKGANAAAEFALGLEEFRLKLEELYAATIGASSERAAHGRRTGSVTTALLRMAEEEVCPETLRAGLAAGQQPRELVAHLRRTFTPEVEARLRGEKNYKLNSFVSRRDKTIRLPDGRRAELLAGMLIEFDDMSANQPFWVRLPDGRFVLSRQGLYARDVASGRWLGVELVARPREAYRAADILRFFRRLMTNFGRFPIFRLERGIWASRTIKGFALDEGGEVVADEFVRPAMDEQEIQSLKKGLASIGLHIDWAHSAHQKIIECGFNYLQRILATYTTDFLNIGRFAGEFETAAKRLRQARNGRDPGELGFAPMDALADRIVRAFEFINRKSSGQGQPDGCTSPDAIWTRDLEARPLPPLGEEHLAAFLPEVREAVIRGGLITIVVDGTPHDFRAEMFAHLGTGHRVFVRFDRSEPTLGAVIYNRETSSANYQAAKMGEFLCWARWEMPGPQIDLEHSCGLPAFAPQEFYGAGAVDDQKALRKAQEKVVRTAYRALPRPGKPAIKVREERDGARQVDRLEIGMDSSTTAAPIPAKAHRPKKTNLPSAAELILRGPMRRDRSLVETPA